MSVLANKPFGSLIYELLRKHVETSKDKVAFINVENKTQLSYKEIVEKSASVISLLTDMKSLECIDRVAICSENNLNYFIPVLGCLYLGCPIVNISHTYAKIELLNALNTTKPSVVFCSRAMFAVISSVCVDNNLEFVKKIIVLEDIDYSDANNTKPDIVELDNHDLVAAMMFSSGTTGLAKAVMLKHENISYFYNQFQDENLLLSHVLNTLVIVPFSHAYGFIMTLVLLATGKTVKFMTKFNEDIFLRSVEEYQIDSLTLVPPLMVWIAKSPKVNEYDLSLVKYIVSGGGPLAENVIEAITKRLPNITIGQVYGMTEVTLAATCTPLDYNPAKAFSVGKALPGVKIAIRSTSLVAETFLGPNEIGEVLMSGPIVTKGYYKNTEETENTFLNNGYVASGDLGYVDNDGYLYIVDRVKDLIKYNAFQVPPAELEGLLLTHGDVIDAAVVGLKDDTHGELPFAFIVKKANSELTASDLQEFIQKLVSYPKYLRGGVQFVDSIPKTPVGKILRRELRDLINRVIV